MKRVGWLLTCVCVLGFVIPVPAQHRNKGPACPKVPHCAWSGIYPTVLAAWHCEGGVDEAALACQIDYQLRGSVHGLLVLGTLGEGEYATLDERGQIIAVAVRTAKGCVPVVVGIHTCDLETAKVQAGQAKQLGAQAILVKYSGRPNACCDEVLGFFAALDEAVGLPIFYYHYPSQTKLKLSAECVAQILSLPGVVGIKESTLDLKEIEQHIRLTQGLGKAFFSGTALNLPHFMEVGGHGAMSPEAVLCPCSAVDCYNALLAGHRARAEARQAELFEITPILRGGMTPVGVGGGRQLFNAAQNHGIAMPMGNSHPQARLKYALFQLGVPIQPIVKCPLPPLDWHDRHKVEQTLFILRDHCGFPRGAGSATCPAPVRSNVARAGALLP
jgi:4-hydroxy-tetrahydrodipicolinate synthase